jgi:putative MATE family efflux protein
MRATHAEIRKAVMTLALPVTVSSLLQRTEGIIAVFLVGGLGASAIAAVGLGQLLAFIGTTLASGLSVGANVVVAQLWGARRQQDAGEAMMHVLAVSGLVSVVLVTLGLSVNRLGMRLLGADEPVVALAGSYSDIIFMVMPLTLLLHVLVAILQGTGDTRTPMYAMIAVNVIHVLAAYPLIYGHGPVPALGLRGAAIAVGAAELAGVLLLFIRLRPLIATSLRMRPDLLSSLWHVGAPVSGERMLQQAGILLYTKIVLLYGTVSYAAHQVGLSIEAFSFLPGYGFAVAAATMVGQSIGAGQYSRAKRENWEANRMAAFIMAGMGLVFFFFPYGLLRAFTDDEAVIALGTTFLKIVALLQVPLALTMVLGGSLRGAGDTRFIMWATLAGMWGIRVPIAIVAALWLHLDVWFVWSAMILDWTARMSLLLLRYRSERWQEIRVFAP